MSERKRKRIDGHKRIDKESPVRIRCLETAGEIIEALDAERIKRKISLEQAAIKSGHARSVWRQIVQRKGGDLSSIAAMCEVLDVQIVLVDREGSALT